MITVTVWPGIDATFALFGDSLVATEGTEYQWYYEGELIEGANEQILYPDQTGDYQVVISNEFGCSDESEYLSVIVTNIEAYELSTISLFSKSNY